MKVGITYDLKHQYIGSPEALAELDSIETVEAINTSLQTLGHDTIYLGCAKELIERLATGWRCDLVFNIAEGVYGSARESQVPAILDVYSIPYTGSDPATLAVCLNKWMAKTVVNAGGGGMTNSYLTDKPVFEVPFPFPVFVKPNSEGTGKGISSKSVVRDPRDLLEITTSLLQKYKELIIESYLPGREYTVGIVGGRVLGTMEIIVDTGIYSYDAKVDWHNRVKYAFVTTPVVESLALSAWDRLGCKDAGRVDIRCDTHGTPYFIEVNPLPGLHPIDSDLPMIADNFGVSYTELIGLIVKSARERWLL